MLEHQEQLIIWGAAGHALVVGDIVRLCGQYRIVAFYDDQADKEGQFDGLPLITKLDQLKALRSEGARKIVLAIGHCNARLRLAELAEKEGFELTTLIHPGATVARGVSIGAGTVMVAGSVINPGSTLGKNAIVNSNATVDHECVIGDGVHIGPGVHLGGGVSVGRATWIGIGAIVKDHVKVGAGTIIGAGAVVLEDVPDGVVAYGVPAKVKGRVSIGE
jgi:UDP-perosamine 4-acetyltransferase